MNCDWNIREEREVSVSFHCQFYLILRNLWIVCQYKSTHTKYFYYLWYKDLVYKSMYLLQMHRLKLAQTSPKIKKNAACRMFINGNISYINAGKSYTTV